MSAIVPWTYPGGPPCCCGDACGSELLANLDTIYSSYARIDVTTEQYQLLRSDPVLEFSMTITAVGNTPSNVPIVSSFPVTLVPTITFPSLQGLGTCYGVGSNNIGGAAGINTFPSALFMTGSNNVIWTFAVRYDFVLYLQDEGQGSPSDAPLSQPAIYLYGVAGQMTRTLPNQGIVFDWDNAGTSAGLAFGTQPLKVSKRSIGGVTDATIDLSLDFAAP